MTRPDLRQRRGGGKGVLIGSMIYYSMNVLWPRQVGQLYETNLMSIGWTSMTIGGGTLLEQIVGGIMCKPLGKQKWQLIIGCAAMTAFIGALAAGNESTRALGVSLTLLGSFAVGYIELVVLTTAPMCLAPEDIGLATGVGGTCRAGSGAIATAIYVTILNNKLAVNIPKIVEPAVVNAGLPESSVPALISGLAAGNVTGVAGMTSVIEEAARSAYRSAYAESFKIVYLASIAFGLLSLAASVLTPNLESKFDDGVARRLHGKDIELVEEKRARNVPDLKPVEGSAALEEVEHV
ncbi:siderophore iron transporter [Phialemonium atrogriseum]|uniref:Siderophore iron transporter n=1 Tax=Phialemonium atrogriseum TaxID=1093897 RepID=A0AAJ0BU45_9PEZI|nr:siderophore iron transporter [Phialemonium atrogriseum]KAK1764525.1 siderophore iron transporter [Phialemonium atrogriseum]